MRFGIVAKLNQIELIEDIGFDYLESSGAELSNLSETEFLKLKKKILAQDISVESICMLFPRDFPFYTVSAQELKNYCDIQFLRASSLGTVIAVLGSGYCRNKPDFMPYPSALNKLIENIRIMGNVAKEYGIIIAIEPLNYSETNMINTLAEGAMLEYLVNLPNVKILADGYHMFYEEEPMTALKTVGAPVHVHVALKEKRAYPTVVSSELSDFIQALREVGYQKRISIEGVSKEFEQDAKKSLETLRLLVKKKNEFQTKS